MWCLLVPHGCVTGMLLVRLCGLRVHTWQERSCIPSVLFDPAASPCNEQMPAG